MTFQLVDRPRGSGNVPDNLIEALVQTESTGKAVKLTLGQDQEFVTWQAQVRARLRNEHNLRLRTKHNKATKSVTCWAEKFAEDRTADIVGNDEALGVDDDNDENGNADAGARD